MEKRENIQALAIDRIGERKRAGIEVSMGVGKTRIGIMHMLRQTEATAFVVVYPKKSIKDSWINEINKTSNQALLSKIIFTTYSSLKKVNPKCVDYLYLDECHSLTPNHNQWLIDYCIKGAGKILGLTGTMPKAGDKKKMCDFYTPCVFSYGVDEAIKDGILNDYRIIIHTLPLDERKNIERRSKKGEAFMSSEKKDYEYWSLKCEDYYQPAQERHRFAIMRMKCLQSFKSKERYAKHLYEEQSEKTLLFANTMEQANYIDANSVHSGNPDSEAILKKFKSGRLNRITSVQQLAEGVTIPNLRTIIIMHSFSNPKQALQKLGRALRLNPKDMATIHILCYKDTVDEKWINDALCDLDQNKITVKQAKYYVES